MKKVLVLNALHSTRGKSCCNIFKKVNGVKSMLSSKAFQEKYISEKFNNISSQGFVFQDQKVFPHNLYVENMYVSSSVHGVYRFTDGGRAKYQVYFGPIIDVTSNFWGCKGVGCKGVGCKGVGCNLKMGCKGLSCSSLGCRSKGGTQCVNFLNDAKNQKSVQILNAHFGLRKKFSREKDDYVYSITGASLNEIVKDHYEEILNQYTHDVEEFYKKGMGFIKTIDTPSSEDLFTHAMLFGTTSSQKAMMADLSSFKVNVWLSRFDVWYFPVVKGLLRRIIEHTPILRWFLSKKKISPTSELTDSNIAIVENIYEKDFNAVEDNEFVAQMVKEAIVGKIPVTLAVKRKLGFWKRIFRLVEYDFHTYLIDAIEG